MTICIKDYTGCLDSRLICCIVITKMANKVRQAIILAGGKGERLRPFTEDRPKPMVEVGGRPIVEYQLDQLAKAGIEEVVFACSYKREVLQKHIGSGSKYGIKASFSIEETPLGRGGGIKQAMQHLSLDWQDVVVLNGDNLWRIEFDQLIAQHQNHSSLATLVVVPLRSPYGIVEFDNQHKIKGFREKPVLPHWINAGVYVFSNKIEPLLPEMGDHETETFPNLSADKFMVYKSEGYWRAVDTIKDLTEASKEVADTFPHLIQDISLAV